MCVCVHICIYTHMQLKYTPVIIYTTFLTLLPIKKYVYLSKINESLLEEPILISVVHIIKESVLQVSS